MNYSEFMAFVLDMLHLDHINPAPYQTYISYNKYKSFPHASNAFKELI